MNKKGIIGAILLILIFIIIIVLVVFYIQLRTKGLEFKTGNIIVKINYNNTNEMDTNTTKHNNISIIEEPIINDADSNLTHENNNIVVVYQNLTAN